MRPDQTWLVSVAAQDCSDTKSDRILIKINEVPEVRDGLGRII